MDNTVKNLYDTAVNVSVKMTGYSGRKHDKDIDKQIQSLNQNDAEYITATKCLIAKEALKTIKQKQTEVRDYFQKMTSPWLHSGVNIMSVKNVIDFENKVNNELFPAIETAVNDFCNNYPALVNDARSRLNGAYKASDYPDIDTIRSKFQNVLVIEPLNREETVKDFRASLPAHVVENMQKQIEQQNLKASQAVTEKNFKRVYEVLSRYVESLNDINVKQAIGEKSKKQIKGMISGAYELVALLPELNLFKNPELDTLKIEIEKKLLPFTEEDLKTDEVKRGKVKQDAEQILNDFKGYF